MESGRKGAIGEVSGPCWKDESTEEVIGTVPLKILAMGMSRK